MGRLTHREDETSAGGRFTMIESVLERHHTVDGGHLKYGLVNEYGTLGKECMGDKN